MRFIILTFFVWTFFHSSSWAQPWPNKPIKLVVGTASGGGPDVIARIVATRMAERLEQGIVVDLKPGAGGLIASEFVANSLADGNTWLLTTTMIHAIMPQLKKQLPYDPIKDFMPISLIGTTANVMVVGKHLGVNTVAQFVTLARSKPGKITYGSAGIGSPAHLAGELFAAMIGVPMVNINYKGATPALTDIAGGQVDMMITSPAAAKTFVLGEKVELLGTTGLKRDPSNPQLPAVSEAVAGFEITQWWGVMIRSGTPKPIADRIHAELVATLNEAKIKTQILAQGGVVQPMEQATFGEFISKERKRYAEIIRTAQFTIE
jgi:tripartite-type tricarboxylate transporter receptor subunit TctC